jgi:hypothetical protein
MHRQHPTVSAAAGLPSCVGGLWRARRRVVAAASRGEPDYSERIIGSLPYLLPLLDAFPYGESGWRWGAATVTAASTAQAGGSGAAMARVGACRATCSPRLLRLGCRQVPVPAVSLRLPCAGAPDARVQPVHILSIPAVSGGAA